MVACRPSDQLVVTKLDRLGRSLEHLIALSKRLQDRGVDMVYSTRASTPPPPSAGCSSRSLGRHRRVSNTP